jgi:hypothetical protein
MKNLNLGLVSVSIARNIFLVIAVCLFFAALSTTGGCGCTLLADLTNPEQDPNISRIGEPYCFTVLKESTSTDVLSYIHNPEKQIYPPYELLSKSKSVLVSTGQNTKGWKVWFNMVAFDENKSTAVRKYMLMILDKWNWMEEPRMDFSFDSETLLNSELLSKPYNDENARKIAILKDILENFRKDGKEVNLDNKALMTASMTVYQAIDSMILKLNDSPAYAAKLEDPNGAEFEDLSFGTGRMEMVVCKDYATLKIRFGKYVDDFKTITCCDYAAGWEYYENCGECKQ